METLYVNLFGGPGSGKSTGASWIFSKLKMSGVESEYIQEFAKDMVWEGNRFIFEDPENQLLIFANQFYRMNRLLGKVRVAITDSPLPLSIFYSKNSNFLGEDYRKMVLEVNSKFCCLNFFINRVKPYNPNGRNQTEQEADQICKEMHSSLLEWGLRVEDIPGSKEGYSKIADRIFHAISLDGAYSSKGGGQE